MDQVILACDDQGKFLEYIPKEVGHTREGRRHLAITVLIYNSTGEVLLQRRKHKVFDNIWDFTASTHPLHKDNGTDETLEEATLRALKNEYEIREVRDLRDLGKFNYFAKIGDLCENEHCAMMVAQYDDGPIKMSKEVGYEYKWVTKIGFLKDVETNPQKFAPWVIEGMNVLKKVFFS